MITIQGEKLKVSDGYHTFDELYEHRCLLYINLCWLQKDRAFWKPDYEGWFYLYLETDSGQISYHCPNYLKPLIIGIQRDDAHKFDGHISEDVVFRLRNEALKLSINNEISNE